MSWKETGIFLLVALTTIVLAPGGIIGIKTAKEGKAIGEEKVINIAHRGARSVAPENTLLAARKAHESGADAWETDVQFTADQSLVLMHDDTLERTTNVESIYPDRESYAVKEFTLEEIRELDAGSWFVESDPFGVIAEGKVSRSEIKEIRRVKVPTLREALELTKRLDWKVNLEIKPLESKANILAEKVVGLVERMDMDNQVIISSFDHSIVRFVGELNLGISLGVLVKEAQPGVLELMRENGAKFYNISGEALDQRQALVNLKKLKEAEEGFEVNVYTVNEQDDLESLVKNPLIEGIFTDFPGRLNSIMSSIYQ